MAEESARVAQRCEAGKESLELLLDGCDLRKFPDAVFFLMREVELQRVSLAHNQLQRIPSKLGLKFTTITGDQCSFKPQKFPDHAHVQLDNQEKIWHEMGCGDRGGGII